MGCYAAPPLPNPFDGGNSTLMYYSGGDGPHSGPRRSDYMALAVAEHSDALVGFRAGGFETVVKTKPLRWTAATKPHLRVTFRALTDDTSLVVEVVDGADTVLSLGRLEA